MSLVIRSSLAYLLLISLFATTIHAEPRQKTYPISRLLTSRWNPLAGFGLKRFIGARGLLGRLKAGKLTGNDQRSIRRILTGQGLSHSEADSQSKQIVSMAKQGKFAGGRKYRISRFLTSRLVAFLGGFSSLLNGRSVAEAALEGGIDAADEHLDRVVVARGLAGRLTLDKKLLESEERLLRRFEEAQQVMTSTNDGQTKQSSAPEFKTRTINGVKVRVRVGDITQTNRTRDYMILPLNSHGRWGGEVDQAVYGVTKGDYHYHDQAKPLIGQSELTHVVAKGKAGKTNTGNFNNITFVVDDGGIKLSKVISKGLEASNNNAKKPARAVLPLMRTGSYAAFGGGNNEVIKEHVAGIASYTKKAKNAKVKDVTIMIYRDAELAGRLDKELSRLESN